MSYWFVDPWTNSVVLEAADLEGAEEWLEGRTTPQESGTLEVGITTLSEV
jgi:hypothetical protein